MVDERIFFNKIEEDKNGYFVSYRPIAYGEKFALLKITFYEKTDIGTAISICENEFNHYIKKYPVPLMVLPINETKEELDFKSATGCNSIMGYPQDTKEPYYLWEHIHEEEFSYFDLSNNNLLKIFSGVGYKTSQDIKGKTKSLQKTKKRAIIIMLLWFSIIPALIAFFGWANPFVSMLALGYSLLVAFKKGGEITGHFKPSKNELEKLEESREKEHHHYHCQLNPEGFLKLKNENFSKDRKQRLED